MYTNKKYSLSFCSPHAYSEQLGKKIQLKAFFILFIFFLQWKHWTLSYCITDIIGIIYQNTFFLRDNLFWWNKINNLLCKGSFFSKSSFHRISFYNTIKTKYFQINNSFIILNKMWRKKKILTFDLSWNCYSKKFISC